MKRLLLIAPLALFLAGCPRNEPEAVPIEEDPAAEQAPLLSNINVADPRAEDHFLGGFHGVEQRAWRWTEKKFSVLLEPPAPVPGHTTELQFNFTIPGVVIETAGPITLTASVNGQEVGSETYDQMAENITFSKEVPADVLAQESPAKVEFELDKAIGPTERDPRELGVIALSIGLQ